MSGEKLDFTRLHFRTPESPDRLWFEWFLEEFARTMFQMEIIPGTQKPYHLDVHVRALPGLSYSTATSAPVILRGASSEEGYALTVPLSGKIMFRWDQEEAIIGPGAASIGPSADVMAMQSDTRFVSVRLSPDILRQIVPNFESLSCRILPPGTDVIRHLLNYLLLFETDERIASPDLRRLVATHVHDLVALAYGTTPEEAHLANGRGGSAARLATIKRNILASLTDPELSASRLAARLGITPRHLHRLFELQSSTYSEYVLGERLTRAHQMLCDPRNLKRPVSDIAYSVGFGDLSYFNQTFKRRFGATPSEIRTAADSGGGTNGLD